MVAIGVPFVAALVLLNPLTNYLVFMFHNHTLSFADYLAGHGTEHAHGPGNWHLHLWFLIALLVYSLLAPLLGKAVDAVMQASTYRIPRPWTTGKLARVVPGLKFFAICAMVCAVCVGWRVAFELVKDLAIWQSGNLSRMLGEESYGLLYSIAKQSEFVVRSTGNLLPYYTLGMVLFASTELRGIFSSCRWFQTLLSCSLLWALQPADGANPGRLQEVLILVLQTYVALCLSSLLFWLAQKLVKGESVRVRFLSDAAYTVYLFHYLVIYLFAMVLREFIPVNGMMLTLAASGTFLITLCLHAFVIQQVPALAFLFNGKPPKRAK
jgi:glucan biosynthesis protein C